MPATIYQKIKYQVIRHHLRRNQKIWKLAKSIQFSFQYLIKRIHQNLWEKNHQVFVDLLNNQNNPDFFFIQIGSNDGIRTDPLYNYIKDFKWNGILIEPQKDAFISLKEKYAENEKIHLENIAIADTDGSKKLFKIKEDKVKYEYELGMATFFPGRMFVNYPKEHITFEVVDCLTFSSLLKKYSIKEIELLQMDVEGYDYEIIKGIDFNYVKPKIIRYEHINLSYYDKRRCKKLLRSLGYGISESECDTTAYFR